MPSHPGSSRSYGALQSPQPRNDKGIEDEHLSPIPAHVSVVKDGLLNFNRFVGLEAVLKVLGIEESDSNDECIPLHAFKASAGDAKLSQLARDREFLENAKGFSRGAKRLESGFAEDSEWRGLFRTAVKHQMDEFDSPDSILPSTIACAENEIWDTNFEPSRDMQITPNPDLYFGFPIYNEEYRQSSGFGNDPSLQHYTMDTLSRLAIEGLRSSPISGCGDGAAEMKRDNVGTQSQSLCFPWCVFQLKGAEQVAATAGNEKLVLETFHLASIAASDALVLLEELARFADVKQDDQHIPPVITITSVGADTTVWLAFSFIVDNQYRSHKMLSIWNGCVSKIWDAVQFCRIMDNIFVWSQRILRPKVTHYIDQWKLRYCPEIPSQHFQLEKDPETAELIYRIQDRLSSLSISPNSNLPELIQQAVILQEVIRSNSPNPGSISTKSERPVHLARDTDARSKFPRHSALTSEIDTRTERNDPYRCHRYKSAKRNSLGRQQAEIPTIPLLDINIPWKGKNIRVKLPPAIPPKKNFDIIFPLEAEKTPRALGLMNMLEAEKKPRALGVVTLEAGKGSRDLRIAHKLKVEKRLLVLGLSPPRNQRKRNLPCKGLDSSAENC